MVCGISEISGEISLPSSQLIITLATLGAWYGWFNPPRITTSRESEKTKEFPLHFDSHIVYYYDVITINAVLDYQGEKKMRLIYQNHDNTWLM